MKCLVLDFGGTFLKYSVMDHELQIYAKGEIPSPSKSVEDFIDCIAGLYDTYQAQVEGIAISMPGVIDAETGYIKSAGALLALYGHNIFELLKDRCPVPVSVENDGKCAALAEAWCGNLKDCRDGVVIILGTAIAGGLIKNHQLHRGYTFSAGEFSFMFLGDQIGIEHSAFYSCSVAALLFNACLAKGIDVKKSPNYKLVSQFRKVDQQLTVWDLNPKYANGFDGIHFFELLEQDDQDIQNVYDDFLFNLAKLIFNVQVLYDPEKILIGGGISRQKRLTQDIAKKVQLIVDSYQGIFTPNYTIDSCKFLHETNQYGALYNYLMSKAGHLLKNRSDADFAR